MIIIHGPNDEVAAITITKYGPDDKGAIIMIIIIRSKR